MAELAGLYGKEKLGEGKEVKELGKLRAAGGGVRRLERSPRYRVSLDATGIRFGILISTTVSHCPGFLGT